MLSEKEAVEYRLPTEAEWEYTCRAGTTTVYSFGDDVSKLGEYAWYKDNSQTVWAGGDIRPSPHPVGQKLPNPWGLYDMHGNVTEWCQDNVPYSEKTVSDPIGPSQGEFRPALRGGSYAAPPVILRSAFRLPSLPLNRLPTLGFRVARTYNLSPSAAKSTTDAQPKAVAKKATPKVSQRAEQQKNN